MASIMPMSWPAVKPLFAMTGKLKTHAMLALGYGLRARLKAGDIDNAQIIICPACDPRSLVPAVTAGDELDC